MNRQDQKPVSSSPIEAAFYSLLRTVGLLRQVMDAYFAQAGISASQWAILRVLHRAEARGEDRLRLTDLGSRLLIQPPSVTGVVGRLERQGLVQRRVSKTDQRARQLSLTEEGRKLVEEVLTAGHSRQIELLFAGYTPEEVQHLADLLNKLELHLEGLARHPLHSGNKPRNHNPILSS